MRRANVHGVFHGMKPFNLNAPTKGSDAHGMTRRKEFKLSSWHLRPI